MKTLALTLVGTALVGGVVAQQAPVALQDPVATLPAAPAPPELIAPAVAAPAVTVPATRFPTNTFFAQPGQSSRSVGLATSPRLPAARWTQSSQNPFFALTTRNSKALSAAARKVDEATRALSAADGDALADAEGDLEDALSELFDEKTTVREEQIAELEKQLATLREQLEQRVDQKARIVRLRLQTIKNEADGLTF